MPNTKVMKRKDVERESPPHPNSSDDELPPNVGNGDLVEELVHVHEKCDDLMAQLKALNQAAGETESAVEISPFVTPELITPVVTPRQEKAQATNAVSQNLECYPTQNVVVETNTDLGQLCGVTTKKLLPIEVNIVIDKAGIWQPLKSIGEMLNEFPKVSSGEISESNIMVDTPVYNQCLADMTHEKKQPMVKAKGLAALKAVGEAKKKGVGHGDGGAASPVTTVPSGRGRGRAPSSAKSGKGVPRKGESH